MLSRVASVGDSLERKPITGRAGCCAPAACGDPATIPTAPPSPAMKSRRRIGNALGCFADSLSRSKVNGNCILSTRRSTSAEHGRRCTVGPNIRVTLRVGRSVRRPRRLREACRPAGDQPIGEAAEPCRDRNLGDCRDSATQQPSLRHRHGAQRHALANPSFSVALLSWPQAARMSRPRGVRTGDE